MLPLGVFLPGRWPLGPRPGSFLRLSSELPSVCILRTACIPFVGAQVDCIASSLQSCCHPGWVTGREAWDKPHSGPHVCSLHGGVKFLHASCIQHRTLRLSSQGDPMPPGLLYKLFISVYFPRTATFKETLIGRHVRQLDVQKADLKTNATFEGPWKSESAT